MIFAVPGVADFFSTFKKRFHIENPPGFVNKWAPAPPTSCALTTAIDLLLSDICQLVHIIACNDATVA